jgi:hypothetical protein
MQAKFRISDETWQLFLNKTAAPSDTLRELVNQYINNGSLLNQIIGVDEAAELWGLSPGYIKNLCAGGKVNAKKIGKTWVIDRNQVNPKLSKTFIIDKKIDQD